MQIIAIGYYASPHELPEFTEEWETQGHSIIRVATDPLNRERVDPKVDLHIYDWLYKLGGMRMILNAEIGLQRISFDALAVELMETVDNIDFENIMVFVQQSNDLVLDFEGSDIPVYYNYTQILKPRVPLNANLRGVICAFPGGIEYLEDICPEVMINVEQTTFIPHGIPKVFMDSGYEIPRDNVIGFKGSISYDGPTEHNWLKKNIYNKREEFLNSFKEKYYIPFLIQQSGGTKSYIDFMHRCKYAINIPAIPGFCNQRQYHAMALGCVLIQYDYPELKKLGFIGGENCFLFKTKEDLEALILFLHDNPDVAGVIRQNALAIAPSHSFVYRAQDIIQFITEVETLVETEGTRWVRKEAELLKLKEMGL